MTITYFAVNGETLDVNHSGNDFLGKITLGLWDLLGIPMPLSDADAKLVARILNNYVKLQEETKNEPEAESYYFWHLLGYKQEAPHTIVWIKKVAKFFEDSNRLLSEDEGMDRLARLLE